MTKNRKHAAGGYANGCMLVAINACIPNLLTTDDLDGQITNLFWAEYPKNALQNYGIPGTSWHQDCIPLALKAKYDNLCYMTSLSPKNIFAQGLGKLYVYGTLNHRFFDSDVYPKEECQHAICVDTNNDTFTDLFVAPEWKSFSHYFRKDRPPCRNLLSNVWFVYAFHLECAEPASILLSMSVPEKVKQERKILEAFILQQKRAHPILRTTLSRKRKKV